MKWFAILRTLGWVLMGAAFLFLLSFTEKQQHIQRCSGARINILPETEETFISEKKVTEIIAGDSLGIFRNKPISDLNAGELEMRLEQNPYVRKAEVFVNVDGELRVEVFQRKPILRIFRSGSGGFYIDEEGWKMPLSPEYTAPVLVASGNIQETCYRVDSLKTRTTRELYQLADYLNKHEFWKLQIAQIFVDEKNEFILYPTVGQHKIVLGDIENLDDKFKRLWLFYKKALEKVGWERYKVINLKYTGQIVCEK